MDDEIERLTVSVRADLGGFRRDVEAMRGELTGPLAAGARRAGDMLEASLLRAVRTGKFGFEDLKRVALSAMAEIAQAALRAGIGAATGGGGGLGGVLTTLLGLGLPGRATGGPVSPQRPYMVGERGPELFVPTASGRVEPMGGAGPREVNVRVQVVAGAGASEPEALARSARQVARAVKRSLGE